MLTDSKCKSFWRFVKKHLAAMCLGEWTIKTQVQEKNRSDDDGLEVTLAQVQISPKHLVCVMTLFQDWGEETPKVADIEATAAHECLHILFGKLMELAMDRHASDKDLQEEEHNVIRRLLTWKGLR